MMPFLRRGIAAGRRGVGAIVLLSLGGTARVATAQDFEEDAPAAAPVLEGFQLDESIFNQWVFGNQNRVASTRDQLAMTLALHVADVERTCSLSEPQKRKLLLAGQGDIKRFNDRVDDAKIVFDRLRSNQNNMNEIYQETQPLAASLATGLYGEGSIFAKAIGTTLDAEQASRYRAAIQEKIHLRHRARVLRAIAGLDSTVGLTSDQYRRFLDLILAETTPPARSSNQYEGAIVLIKIARLPESKVRPIFDEVQWTVLSRQLMQARGMEGFLQSQGFLEAPAPIPPVGPTF